jgi:hypothetical protein
LKQNTTEKKKELYPFYIFKALGMEVAFLFLAVGLDSESFPHESEN